MRDPAARSGSGRAGLTVARVMDSARPAALLLTGGASRRLGRDKASLSLGATTLAERTAGLLMQVARPVIEVGPGHTGLVHVREAPAGGGPLAAMAAGWAELTRAELTRAELTRTELTRTELTRAELTRAELTRAGEPGAATPRMAGAAGTATPSTPAAATGATTPGVLVVATDLPCLTAGLLRLLAGHPTAGCLVPLDAAGRPQLLCARYTPIALRRAVRLVGEGRRAVRDLLEGEDVTWLAPADWLPAAGSPDALADVDTPADLDRLLGREAVGR